MIKEEGLLVGGSAGAAMSVALQEAKLLKKDQRLVVLFADGLRNYISKYISDDWMYEMNFLDEKSVLKNSVSNLVENKAWG